MLRDITDSGFVSKCCNASVIADQSNPNWTTYTCPTCGHKSPLSVEDLLKASGVRRCTKREGDMK